jgi:hypothetical protein
VFDNSFQKRLDEGLNCLRQKLKETHADPFAAEQYKLLLDAAQKSEERKKDIHSFFLTGNSIYASFLIKFSESNILKSQYNIMFPIFIVLGIMLCLDWVWILGIYKKNNYVNYTFIRAFEEYLPTSVFSLRDKIIEPGLEYIRANLLTRKETIIPLFFAIIYVLYFFISIFYVNI